MKSQDKNRKSSGLLLTRCVCMTLALVFCLAACKNDSAPEPPGESLAAGEESSEQSAQQGKDENVFSLAYDSGDSLNPLTLKNECNYRLMPLLYDPLVRLDPNFVPDNCLAEEVKLEGSACTVTLRQDRLFSDGSAVTAQDVVYSIESYLKTENIWKASLSGIASVKKNNDHALTIQLKSPDALFINLLTFPIIKNQSGGGTLPVGAGKYVYSAAEGASKLQVNTRHPQASELRFAQIELQVLPDKDAVIYGVKTGSIDCAFVSPSQLGSFNMGAGFSTCTLNRLVFLGTKNDSGIFADAVFRRAVHMALNRSEIASTGYGGFGVPAYFPFNPVYPAYTTLDPPTRELTAEKAQALLTEAGYTLQNGKLVKGGKEASVRLLVNDENSYKLLTAKVIEKELEKIGISVEIKQTPFTDFQAAITKGEYDFYLGEVSLPANLDLNCLLGESGRLPGISRGEQSAQAYAAYKAGGSLAGFTDAFAAEVPFIPLLFGQGVALYGRSLPFSIQPSAYDMFYNIATW